MRLIDADAFLAGEIKRCHCVPLVGSCEKDYEPLTCILDQEPSIDAVPVVRCKDCIYSIEGRCFSRTSFLNAPAVKPDNFCSWGATE